MRYLCLLFIVFSLGACETAKKVQPPPRDMKQFLTEVTPPSKTVKHESHRTKDVPFTREEATFKEVITKEGIPTENIIPRRKEQIAIYKKSQKVVVYYFIENNLYSKKEYAEQDMHRLKENSEYPENLYKELGVFK